MPTQPSRRPPLDQAALAAAAGPRWRVELLAAVPSTNAVAVDRARAGEPEGLVVVADHQTAGRGRLDRGWVTPAGVALTFSALLRPEGVPPARWPWLPLLAGLAVADGVRRSAGVAATLKWPNDVLVDDLKVAGILVERVETAAGAAAVVGIGVNVSQTRDELPVETATSLRLAAGEDQDRTDLLGEVLAALADRHRAWRSVRGEPTDLRAAYLGLCRTVGRPVRVLLPDGRTVAGTAQDVDVDGRLVVADERGVVTALGAGDVVHVRPRG